jgi:hypothetical protein
MKARFDRFGLRMDQVPPHSRQRTAWDNRPATLWLSTVASNDTSFTRQEFQFMFAKYFGLPIPALRDHISKPLPRDCGLQRAVDRYGDSLSLYMGPGHWKNTEGRTIERVVKALASQCGVAAKDQDHGFFLGGILDQGQRAQMRADQLHHDSGIGYLVPDLVVEGLPSNTEAEGRGPVTRICELKNFGFRRDFYLRLREVRPPYAAVQEKAASIPAEYVARAKRADRRYNGTEEGVVGPMETLLATMVPPKAILQGWAFGFYSEWSEGVDTFVNDLVNYAAVERAHGPQYFGLCYG